MSTGRADRSDPAGTGARAGLRRRVAGLYAVTPEESATDRLVRMVDAALTGGASVLQYRCKSRDHGLRREQALRLVESCRRHRALFIVNDDLELALATGADGLHIGRDDGDVSAARVRLPSEMLLGVSCYDQLELAFDAVRAGADYVAFGSAFASPTKPDAVRAPPELFRRARTELAVPIVAIGGITPENARLVTQAGADAVAVISALFDAPDVAAAAAQFRQLFERRQT